MAAGSQGVHYPKRIGAAYRDLRANPCFAHISGRCLRVWLRACPHSRVIRWKQEAMLYGRLRSLDYDHRESAQSPYAGVIDNMRRRHAELGIAYKLERFVSKHLLPELARDWGVTCPGCKQAIEVRPNPPRPTSSCELTLARYEFAINRVVQHNFNVLREIVHEGRVCRTCERVAIDDIRDVQGLIKKLAHEISKKKRERRAC